MCVKKKKKYTNLRTFLYRNLLEHPGFSKDQLYRTFLYRNLLEHPEFSKDQLYHTKPIFKKNIINTTNNLATAISKKRLFKKRYEVEKMENIIEKVCGIRRTRQGEIQKKKSLVRNYSRTLLNVKNARTNIRSILHYDPKFMAFHRKEIYKTS